MTRWTIPLLLIGTAAHAGPWPGPAAWTGKVVGVSDGDTVQVLLEGKPVKVRLSGVDAPEKDQPFGQRAKQFTAQLVFGKAVKVAVKEMDHWGRVVGEVEIDGNSLGDELLAAGLAWWYQRYAPKETKRATLEARARQARRGLWADAHPTPPWEFRKREKARAELERTIQKKQVLEALQRSGGQPVQVLGTGQGEAVEDSLSRALGPGYRGNVRSKVFHAAGCRDFRCTHCTATFSSEAEAKAAGYRPHPECAGAGRAGRRGARP